MLYHCRISAHNEPLTSIVDYRETNRRNTNKQFVADTTNEIEIKMETNRVVATFIAGFERSDRNRGPYVGRPQYSLGLR